MNSTTKENTQVKGGFAHRLLDWYGQHARAMPWRISPEDHAAGVRPDPYKVWLSEVMLQQTQVATVHDYFLKFERLWPTIEDLAAADLEDILKAWAGLGYYSRARNLKKCADEIVSGHDGNFPNTYETLIRLPGIGDYTASAIASIAFNEPVAVVDGDVERVISRHYRIKTPFPAAKPKVNDLLSGILDCQKPGEFAQAMMDLGATICTSKKPACALCPIHEDCESYKSGDTDAFPRKPPKKAKPTRKGAAFVIENEKGEVFLRKRPNKGLLAGMTEVPTTNWTARQDGETGSNAAPLAAKWKLMGHAKHTFTHFHLELEVWQATVFQDVSPAGWWCKKGQLDGEALPTIMRKVLQYT